MGEGIKIYLESNPKGLREVGIWWSPGAYMP